MSVARTMVIGASSPPRSRPSRNSRKPRRGARRRPPGPSSTRPWRRPPRRRPRPGAGRGPVGREVGDWPNWPAMSILAAQTFRASSMALVLSGGSLARFSSSTSGAPCRTRRRAMRCGSTIFSVSARPGRCRGAPRAWRRGGSCRRPCGRTASCARGSPRARRAPEEVGDLEEFEAPREDGRDVLRRREPQALLQLGGDGVGVVAVVVLAVAPRDGRRRDELLPGDQVALAVLADRGDGRDLRADAAQDLAHDVVRRRARAERADPHRAEAVAERDLPVHVLLLAEDAWWFEKTGGAERVSPWPPSPEVVARSLTPRPSLRRRSCLRRRCACPRRCRAS